MSWFLIIISTKYISWKFFLWKDILRKVRPFRPFQAWMGKESGSRSRMLLMKTWKKRFILQNKRVFDSFLINVSPPNLFSNMLSPTTFYRNCQAVFECWSIYALIIELSYTNVVNFFILVHWTFNVDSGQKQSLQQLVKFLIFEGDISNRRLPTTFL